MRYISRLIIHCTDTPASMDVTVETVRKWHQERGFDDIGYHYLIDRSGTIHQGRPEETIGAHAIGHNFDSLGIALSGGKGKDGKPENNFTPDQFTSLKKLINDLKSKHPIKAVIGHNEVSNKSCPCFDVKTVLGN